MIDVFESLVVYTCNRMIIFKIFSAMACKFFVPSGKKTEVLSHFFSMMDLTRKGAFDLREFVISKGFSSGVAPTIKVQADCLEGAGCGGKSEHGHPFKELLWHNVNF